MRLVFFIVEQLDGEDAQGAAFMVKVKSQMNAAIKGTLFLPPYLRSNQCNIAADSVLFGCLDEIIGKGFAIFGQEDADYQYFLDADLEIRKTRMPSRSREIPHTMHSSITPTSAF